MAGYRFEHAIVDNARSVVTVWVPNTPAQAFDGVALSAVDEVDGEGAPTGASVVTGVFPTVGVTEGDDRDPAEGYEQHRVEVGLLIEAALARHESAAAPAEMIADGEM